MVTVMVYVVYIRSVSIKRWRGGGVEKSAFTSALYHCVHIVAYTYIARRNILNRANSIPMTCSSRKLRFLMGIFASAAAAAAAKLQSDRTLLMRRPNGVTYPFSCALYVGGGDITVSRGRAYYIILLSIQQYRNAPYTGDCSRFPSREGGIRRGSGGG